MPSRTSAGVLALALAFSPAVAMAKTKPAATLATDPPMVVGESYEVEGRVFTPTDGPFDDVGFAGMAGDLGADVAVSHPTLPIPSYVEVTALDTGRTILARVEKRGPGTLARMIGLSPAAVAQLGEEAAGSVGVRVRRVNPQEYERALLRTGQRAPERLPTPRGLLEVLRKRLANLQTDAGTATRLEPVALPETGVAASAANRTARPAANAATSSWKADRSTGKAAPARTSGQAKRYVVVATFSSKSNASSTARKLGGSVAPSGKLWRVFLGPFATDAQVRDALDRARRAGFADARASSAK